MSMTVRYARHDDYPAIARLLQQICTLHAQLRPDIFRSGGQKYSQDDFAAMLNDVNKPVLVAVDDTDAVQGYAFCQIKTNDSPVLCHDKVLFIDDLCVDEACRAGGIGGLLFDECVALARECKAARVELSVWQCNQSAIQFYLKRHMTPQRAIMELPL